MRRVHFEGGLEMRRGKGEEYLGTSINATADPTKEVNRRIASARVAEEQLKTFWREGKISRKWSVLMYNAIVVTKLMYGLEALPLNDTSLKKLDAFCVISHK